MYGFKILCEISKGTFEISHKILNPYTATYAFHCFSFFCVWVTTSFNCDIISLSETGPWIAMSRQKYLVLHNYWNSYRIMNVLQWQAVHALARTEINTKMTPNYAHEQFAPTVPTLFHFLHDLMNLQMMIKNNPHTSAQCLVRSLKFCWWRHNRWLKTSLMDNATRQL